MFLHPAPPSGENPIRKPVHMGGPGCTVSSRKGPWEARSPGLMERDQGWRREGNPRGSHLEKWQTLATPGKGEDVQPVSSLLGSCSALPLATICERHRPTQKLMLSQKTFSKVGSHEGDRDQARQRQGWGSEIMKKRTQRSSLPWGPWFQASSSSWVLPRLLMNTESTSS